MDSLSSHVPDARTIRTPLGRTSEVDKILAESICTPLREQAEKSYAVSPSKPLLSKVKQNAYSCGDNSSEQLGQMAGAMVAEPSHISGGPGGWAEVNIGGSHSAGLGCDGALYVWGSNDAGQCGRQLETAVLPQPVKVTQVSGLSKEDCKYKAVACGASHTIALTDKSVVAFGSNQCGQLGLGPGVGALCHIPTIVPSLQGACVTQVVCGGAHVLCVTSQSKVYGWGANEFGQLGLGDMEQRDVPVVVTALWALPVVQLAAGENHSAAVTANGHMFCWGCNAHGQLGRLSSGEGELVATQGREGGLVHVDDSLRRTARQAHSNGFTMRVVAMVDMGLDRDVVELALEETGNVGVEVATEWLFSVDPTLLEQRVALRRAAGGGYAHAQGGRTPPRGAGSPNTRVYSQRSAGGEVSGVCDGGGGSGAGVWANGLAGAGSGELDEGGEAGGAGQEWDPYSMMEMEPCRVPLKNVRHVSAGTNFTVAVADDGVFSWGSNSSGALGLGDFDNRHLPCRVDSLDSCSIERVACGTAHTLFLSRTGALYGCGACSSGQLTQRPLQMGMQEGLALPVKLALPFGVSHQRHKSPHKDTGAGCQLAPVIHEVVAGAHVSAFLTRLPGEIPTTSHVSLLSRLEAALDRAACRGFRSSSFNGSWHGPSASPKRPHPAPLTSCAAPSSPPANNMNAAAVAKGVEMVFGSAAAFNAAFGYRDRVGIDVELLHSIQCAILRLFESDALLGGPPRHTTFSLHTGEAGEDELTDRHQLKHSHSMTACQGAGSSAHAPVLAEEEREPSGRGRQAGSSTSSMGGLQPPSLYPPVPPAHLPDETQATGGPRRLALDLGPSSSQAGAPSLYPPVPPARLPPGDPPHTSVLGPRQRSSSSSGGGKPSKTSPHKEGAAPRVVLRDLSGLHLYNMAQAMFNSVSHLLDELADHIHLLRSPERAQVLLGAAQNPLMSEAGFARVLLPKLAATIVAAPSAAKQLLVKWWSETPSKILLHRVVRPMLSFLSRELLATKMLNMGVMNVIKVLALIEEANQIGRVLPSEALYSQLISEKMDVQDHYTAWRQTQMMCTSRRDMQGVDMPFSFCSYPFLLDARAKSNLMHIEARFQMEQSVAQARMEQQLYGGSTRKDESVLSTPLRQRVAQCSTAYSAQSRGSSAGQEHAGRGSTGSGGDVAQDHDQAAHGLSGSGSGRGSQQASKEQGDKTPRTGWRAASGIRGIFNILRQGASRSSSSAADVATQDQGRGAPTSDGFSLPVPSMCPMPGVHSDMCILRVRRTHLLQDAMEEIGRQLKGNLFKPLRVHFIGEDGIDAGGVKKEFFLLLISELLSPDLGIMERMDETNTYWFRTSSQLSEEDINRHLLLGVVLGLAVYNRVLLDFPLPLVLYKKLLGTCPQQLRLRDLEDMQPSVGRSLRSLLEFDPEEAGSSVESTFFLTFCVEQGSPSGCPELIELKPGGEKIPVTEESRHEYVELMVEHLLVSSVAAQFDAFSNGFRMLCDGPAIRLFNPQELERLVCGSPHLDFNALQQNAKYEGGFSSSTPVVQWLWGIVGSELTLEEKKRFLKFFTGSDRAPIGGLGSLRCIIQRDGTDSGKLPTSHTCFNTLLLPEYSTRCKLESLLKLAIMNSEGFGLE